MTNGINLDIRFLPRAHLFSGRFTLRASVVLLGVVVISSFTPVVQAASPDGTGVTIAVIDNTGIDSASPELLGVIVHEVCLDALAQFNSINGIAHCPNKQSVDEDPGAATTSFATNGDSQYPGGGHGTAVASVIAGVTVGVAKKVKIVAIRELHLMSPAFEWIHANAKKYNITAVVMSEAWSIAADSRSYVPCSLASETKPTGQQNALAPYIATLKADGLAIFIAAGNEGFTSLIDSPSCIQGVFGVGASDGNSVAGYSNISAEVSILAPGTNMVSTTVSKDNFTVTSQQGTSFAAPYAGAVYAKVKVLYPNLAADQILAAMRSTGTLVDDIKVKHIPTVNQDALFAFLATGKAIPDLASTFVEQKASYTTGNSDSLIVQNNSLVEQNKKMQGQIDDLVASSKALADQLKVAQSQQGDVAVLQSQIDGLRDKNDSLMAQLAAAIKKSAIPVAKTLTCIKGGSIKKVTSIRPTCPTGWKPKL